jgi:hypothetical protein
LRAAAATPATAAATATTAPARFAVFATFASFRLRRCLATALDVAFFTALVALDAARFAVDAAFLRRVVMRVSSQWFSPM